MRAKTSPTAKTPTPPRNEPRTGADNELLIYGEIGESYWGESVLATDVSAFLRDFGAGDEIVVRINSMGGDAFAGVTIYNLLRDHPSRCIVKIDGAAISAASIIAMAGDEVRMAENALMMIHDPWTFSMGNSSEMRAVADRLDKVAEALATTYVSKTGQSTEDVRRMMSVETWMTASEAIEKGFADKVEEVDLGDDEAESQNDSEPNARLPQRIAARYRNVPKSLMPPHTNTDPDRVTAHHVFTASGHESVVATYDEIASAANAAAERVEALTKITSPANERGATKENNMDITEIQTALNKANEDIGALKKDHADTKAKLDAANAQILEVQAKADALEKQNTALATERDGALKNAAELSLKLTEQEVDALVGTKISAAERDDFVALAQTNRELFDKFVAQRAPMSLLKRDPAGMGVDPKPAPIDAAQNGADFANIVNAAAFG